MEEKILQFMSALDITREEAIELIESDREVDRMTSNRQINSDLTPEQQKVAKKMKNTGQKTKKVSAYGQTTTRERKADADKDFLVTLLRTTLEENVTELNQTKPAEMEFTYNGRKFKIVLSAPRK